MSVVVSPKVDRMVFLLVVSHQRKVGLSGCAAGGSRGSNPGHLVSSRGERASQLGTAR